MVYLSDIWCNLNGKDCRNERKPDIPHLNYVYNLRLELRLRDMTL